MTTNEAIKFSEVDIVESKSAIPACLTGIRVITHSGMPSVTTWKRPGRKVLLRVSSTGQQVLPVPRVTRWKNPTLVGGTFEVRRRRPAGAHTPLLLSSPPNTASCGPSRPARQTPR